LVAVPVVRRRVTPDQEDLAHRRLVDGGRSYWLFESGRSSCLRARNLAWPRCATAWSDPYRHGQLGKSENRLRRRQPHALPALPSPLLCPAAADRAGRSLTAVRPGREHACRLPHEMDPTVQARAIDPLRHWHSGSTGLECACACHTDTLIHHATPTGTLHTIRYRAIYPPVRLGGVSAAS
jgi:hypothetical protein